MVSPPTQLSHALLLHRGHVRLSLAHQETAVIALAFHLRWDISQTAGIVAAARHKYVCTAMAIAVAVGRSRARQFDWPSVVCTISNSPPPRQIGGIDLFGDWASKTCLFNLVKLRLSKSEFF